MRRLPFALLILIASISAVFAQAPTTYRLQAEDVVSIRVYGEQDMSVDAAINYDGTIGVPFLGLVKAAGKTTGELEQYIRNELMTRQYFKDPKVTVNVFKFRELRASVVGGANRPGEFQFKPGDRLLSLIAQAQGPGCRCASRRFSVR